MAYTYNLLNRTRVHRPLNTSTFSNEKTVSFINNTWKVKRSVVINMGFPLLQGKREREREREIFDLFIKSTYAITSGIFILLLFYWMNASQLGPQEEMINA